MRIYVKCGTAGTFSILRASLILSYLVSKPRRELSHTLNFAVVAFRLGIR